VMGGDDDNKKKCYSSGVKRCWIDKQQNSNATHFSNSTLGSDSIVFLEKRRQSYIKLPTISDSNYQKFPL
jgi:hypothetical protein